MRKFLWNFLEFISIFQKSLMIKAKLKVKEKENSLLIFPLIFFKKPEGIL
jgi:hypothetical protein